MLILTRRVGETLVIGDDVKVFVLGVKGNQVRLGIDAPKNVPVNREEIYKKIQAEKELEKQNTSIIGLKTEKHITQVIPVKAKRSLKSAKKI